MRYGPEPGAGLAQATTRTQGVLMTAIRLSSRRAALPTVLSATVFGGALAVAISTAPGAYADTEQQIKDNCAAWGGTYATHIAANGDRVSQCCVPTNQGLPTVHHLWCRYYVNGDYDGAGIYAPPPPDSTQPGPPTPVNPGPPVNAPGG
jgi:hypothetical protein